MSDWVYIILACIAGYLFFAGIIEYQRNDISGEIDKMFKRDEDHMSFFAILQHSHQPSTFYLQIIAGAGILAFFGRIVMGSTIIRVLLFSGPVLFSFQLLLLEWDVKNIQIMLFSYVLSIVITYVSSKLSEIYVGICTGVVLAYFMFYMMTFDLIKQEKEIGITALFPMFLAGILLTIAMVVFAYGNLNNTEIKLFKRYITVQMISYSLSLVYFGYYNYHLRIAGKKIQKHEYDSHMEHYIIYIGVFMTFLLGGSILISQFIWVQYAKAKPFFLDCSEQQHDQCFPETNKSK